MWKENIELFGGPYDGLLIEINKPLSMLPEVTINNKETYYYFGVIDNVKQMPLYVWSRVKIHGHGWFKT